MLSALSLIHKEAKEWRESVVEWEHPDAKDVLHGLAWLWDIIKVDPLAAWRMVKDDKPLIYE